MRLEISREVLRWVLDQAVETPTVEVCGLLLGKGMHVTAAIAAANVAETPETAFEIDPRTLIAAHKMTRGGGTQIVGHYHSHPNGRTDPSERDAAMARGGEIWLIVGDGDAAAWLVGDDGRFERLSY